MYVDHDKFVEVTRKPGTPTTAEGLELMCDAIINVAAAMYEPEGEDPQAAVRDYLADILFLLTCVAQDAGESLGKICSHDVSQYVSAVEARETQNLFDAMEVAEEMTKKDLH